MPVRILSATLTLALATTSVAAGFDCAQADTRIERAICGNDDLSTLDEHLGRYYEGARLELGVGAACLQDDQRRWLKQVRDRCHDEACLRRVYLERLAELDALQPDATAIKDDMLPRLPSLVWIIPPAQDQIAAPPRPNARPLSAEGVLVDDVDDGDGYVLRTSADQSLLLVPLMLLDGETHTALASLIRSGGARYRARGYKAVDDGGRVSFESSRCVFLYRLPEAEPGLEGKETAEDPGWIR